MMSTVPRVGEVITDGPDNLIVTRVEWFEYSTRHQWMARIYAEKQ